MHICLYGNQILELRRSKLWDLHLFFPWSWHHNSLNWSIFVWSQWLYYQYERQLSFRLHKAFMSIGDNEEERNLSCGTIIMAEIEDPIAFYAMPKLWMVDSQEFSKTHWNILYSMTFLSLFQIAIKIDKFIVCSTWISGKDIRCPLKVSSYVFFLLMWLNVNLFQQFVLLMLHFMM